MPVDLVVPEVGESITEVEIGKWLVDEGDRVDKDQPLVEIETDKVTLELPAPAAGTITKITHQQGAEAAVGDVIGAMEEGDGGSRPSAGGEKKQQQAEGDEEKQDGETATATADAPQAPQAPETSESADASAEGGEAEPKESKASEEEGKDDGGGEPRIMPAAQRLLDEHGLDASQIEATGPGGRLLKEDVLAHFDKRDAGSDEQKQRDTADKAKTSGNGSAPSKAEPAPKREAAPAKRAEAGDREEVVPMTPLRRRIAERLVEAQHNAAMLTTFNECDMSAVMDLRSRYKEAFEKKYEIKLGFMSFFVKAVVDALLQFPQVGGEVRGTDIILKHYVDIGIAVGTGKGLVVPVLRDADAKSFAEIEQAIADFGKRAQAGKLALDELQGGTFTITNGGVFGSMLSTPIINPPQSAVLGMHNIQRRPMAVGTPGKDERIEIRPMMYLALSYDHRLIDGREAVTFLKRIKDTIEEPSRMLMEV